MDHKALINKLITEAVLSEDLVELHPGASDGDIARAEKRLGLRIDTKLKQFLKICNGANLEVIRTFSSEELQTNNHGIAFAGDPSGFVYYLSPNNEVICEDTDEGDAKTIASSFEEFFFSYLFGKRSHEFMGEDWSQELRDAGVST